MGVAGLCAGGWEVGSGEVRATSMDPRLRGDDG